MAKKPTKSKADAVDPVYRPSLYLDGKDAQKMQGHPVGKKVKVMVDATVTRHSQSQDMMGGKSHSTSLEINKIRPHTTKKTAPKRMK